MAAAPADPRLPAFVIIGAAKAATTWIVHQLQQHPDICLPGPEPHYFSTEYHRGPDWYAGWFQDAAPGQTIGEKSADYLAHPQAAQRLAALLPGARLVVQLRNPVERAYSDYCMLYRRGTVTKSPESYLRSGAGLPRFLEDGLYHRHLSRFLDAFPRDNIALLLHEDIRSAPQDAITRVCTHVGVVPRIVAAEVGARVNAGETPLLPLGLRRALAPMKQIAAPLRHLAAFKAAHRLLARSPRYPPLTHDLRCRLRDFYAADIEKLGAIVDRDVSGWLDIEPAR